LQGIELARLNWPWAGVFNIWYFRQTGQQYTPNDAAYYFRMVDVDFTPRRVYDAVEDATSTLFVATAGRFEETNPAVIAGSSWRGVIAPDASGQGLFESNLQDARLTFTFHGHSVDLIARQGPEEGRLLVTLDGRSVSGLPTDEQGRSYLALYAPNVAWQARMPIASGLAPDQHVVRLTVSDGQPAMGNIDAFEVNTGQPPSFPIVPVAILGLGVLVLAAVLVWDLRARPRREKFF
jgi:hypothetical protein